MNPDPQHWSNDNLNNTGRITIFFEPSQVYQFAVCEEGKNFQASLVFSLLVHNNLRQMAISCWLGNYCIYRYLTKYGYYFYENFLSEYQFEIKIERKILTSTVVTFFLIP